MDKVASMRMFCRVAELGSFVAAAREFRLSTTMASKHVANLEKSLGVTLLNRTTRKVSLTEIGSDYYQRSKQLLDELMELDASMSQLGNLPQGTLKICAPIDFGGSHMVPAIKAYREQYPQIAVQLTLENHPIDLADGVFDLSIRLTNVVDIGLIAKVIRSTGLCAYASPAYLAAHGEPATPQDLRNHQCLHFLDTPHGEYWIFQDKDRQQKIKTKWVFASNNSRVLCDAAVKGMGIVQVPEISVAPYLKTGELLEILHEYQIRDLRIYAIYAQHRFIPAKISSFVNFMATFYRTYEGW